MTKPSEKVTYIVTLTNDGSIPALLKTVNSSNNKLGWGSNVAGDQAYYHFTYKIGADYWINDSYCDDEEAELAKIILNPNETMTIEITHLWKKINNSITG